MTQKRSSTKPSSRGLSLEIGSDRKLDRGWSQLHPFLTHCDHELSLTLPCATEPRLRYYRGTKASCISAYWRSNGVVQLGLDHFGDEYSFLPVTQKAQKFDGKDAAQLAKMRSSWVHYGRVSFFPKTKVQQPTCTLRFQKTGVALDSAS